MLGPDDPLPWLPRRVLLAGVSGTGKTTLAARIAEIVDAPHIELDSLHWGPGWTPRPEFDDDVDALVARDRWVTEWPYRAARERLATRAEMMVWLDYPTRTSMARVVRRTLGRRLRRVELWHGNVEPPLWTIVVDRDHIVRWAWRTRRKYRTPMPSIRDQHPQLLVVRLRGQAETDRWLVALRTAATR